MDELENVWQEKIMYTWYKKSPRRSGYDRCV